MDSLMFTIPDCRPMKWCGWLTTHMKFSLSRGKGPIGWFEGAGLWLLDTGLNHFVATIYQPRVTCQALLFKTAAASAWRQYNLWLY